MLKRLVVTFDGLGSQTSEAPAAEGEVAVLVKVALNVDLAGVGIGGDLWPAATMFSNVVVSEAYRGFFSELFCGKNIIELGSGTGLCGILIDKMFSPASVVITDQESHMALISSNIALNDTSSVCTVSALDWTDHATFPPEPFDVVLALECVYKEGLYSPLIDALVHCLRPGGVILLGLTRQFAKPLFFQKLVQRGLQYCLIPHESLPAACVSSTGGNDCGLFVLQTRPSNIDNCSSL